MRLLNFIDRGLARLEGFMICVLFLVMILLAFSQVVARNFFSTGMLWADITVRFLFLWVGLLGAALATHLSQHLSIDVFTKFLGGRSQRVVGFFVKLFAAIVCLYLLQASWAFIIEEQGTGEKILALMPAWYAQIIIPISFALISFHLLISIIGDLNALYCSSRGRS